MIDFLSSVARVTMTLQKKYNPSTKSYLFSFKLLITNSFLRKISISELFFLVLTNNINQMVSGIAAIDISDHLPTLFIVDISEQKQIFQRCYRDYRRFDSELYLQDIKTIDGNSIYTESNDLNVLQLSP